MKSLIGTRLTPSVWPLILVAPPEILAAAVLITRGHEGTGPGFALAIAALGIAIGTIAAVAVIVAARVLAARPRNSGLRTSSFAVLVYIVASMLGGLIGVVAIDWLVGTKSFSAVTLLLYLIARPINVIVFGIVIDQLRDAVRTMRTVNDEVVERVVLAQQTNAMLQKAEWAMKRESREVLAERVARPLRRIARTSDALNDDDAAEALDRLMAESVRPLAHELHPVSVRLGLVSAVRSLDPDVGIDASPAVERMDRDGALLDDDVRLQVYRWIRERLAAGRSTRVALVLRGREIEVSMHPAGTAPLDAIQVVAGLRQVDAATIAAPLRGQTPTARQIAGEQVSGTTTTRVRQRLRDVLTVPLPFRAGLVALISLGSAPLQLVFFRWPLTWQSSAAIYSFMLSAIAMAAVFALLPAPRPTIAGATRVVIEWVLTAVVSALVFAVVSVQVGLYASVWENAGIDVFRSMYRYTITGLILVIAHGLVVQAHRALRQATEALDREDQRQAEILAESRQLDAFVAEGLHRTVQGRLAAAVVLIRLGRRAEARDILIDIAATQVPMLLGRFSMSSGPIPDPPAGLSVSVDGEPATIPEELVDDVRTAIGEIAMNARRHGGATQLSVQLVWDGDRLTIECIDNGTGPGDPIVEGLGSRLLDQVSSRHGGSWSMERAQPGCRVRLELCTGVRSPVLESSSA